MTKSQLTDVTILSPNCYRPRAYSVTKITPHHMAGNLDVETLGGIFASPSRQASSNYGIGTDGRIACYVEEENAAWTSASWENDNSAITFEIANDNTDTWSISDAAWKSTVALCVDICKRYGIPKLVYTGDASGNLTEHLMFAATACPGPWLHARMQKLADEVNAQLNGPGWVHDDTGWWYKNADGTWPANCWKKIDGEWYLFGADGYMLTGWQKRDGKWYYLDESGAMLTGWQWIKSAWYLLAEDGHMLTGWQEIKGKWYYLNPDGSMLTGWLEGPKNWYWFDKDGVMAANKVIEIAGKCYGFNKDGHMVTDASELEVDPNGCIKVR